MRDGFREVGKNDIQRAANIKSLKLGIGLLAGTTTNMGELASWATGRRSFTKL